MMDSQEKKDALKTQNTPENKIDMGSENNTEKTVFNTKQEIIDRLRLLLNDAENTNKSELDTLKQVFYKLHMQELADKQEKFVQDGGKVEDFKPTPDPLEIDLKNLIDQVKEIRRKIAVRSEELKEENLKKKTAIIEKIKSFVDSPEDANNSYKEFKELQNQWNDIRLIPQSKANELWRTYQLYVEQYYDMLKLNHEFREYDFKKNLELKTELCELAEKLDEEPDVISAFHQLQKFHQQWREIGPVAKELREDLWERFKEASTVINKKHQAYFDEIKAQEVENLKAKTEICETIEKIELDKLENFTDWNKKTDEVLALQEQWKTIGFTPRKMNTKIFERFRAACDLFFNTKAEFFQDVKEEMVDNLSQKEALCEQAEALKDSTDWKKTTADFIKLQKDWKKIGPVHKSKSNMVWKRFSAACDYFFEKRNQQNAEQRKAQTDNLALKKEVITKLEELTQDETKASEVNEEVHELIKQWNSIGHVPFKVKDSIYKQYRDLIDKHFQRANKGQAQQKISNFKTIVSSIQEGGNENALYREREKLMRKVERLKSDLATYENNLGFLTLSSKKGNSLIEEVTRKVERLRTELEVFNKKIEVIDQSIFRKDEK